jgi:hypothetical protein
MEIKNRLGNFFIYVGLGLLFLYWMTAQGVSPQPERNFLLLGAINLGFGLWYAWRNRAKLQDVERFTTLRKLFNRGKKK